MRARTYFKRVAILVSVVFLLCVCVVVIALFSLPDVGEIRDGFRIFRRQPLQPPSVNVTTSGATAAAPPPSPVPATRLSPPPLPATAVTAAPNVNPVTDYLVTRFVDEGDTSVRACDNMADTNATPPKNPQELEQQLLSVAESRVVENPFIESAIAPLGAVLARPDVGDMVDEIRNARETGDTSFVTKAQFYTQAADVATSLFSDQTSLELVSQHAYHLYVLGKVAQLVPGIITDDGFANFCGELENKITAIADGERPASVEEAIQTVQQEKGDMLELLASYGLTPARVGYNPNMPSNVRFQISLQRVALATSWMTKEFGTSVSLSGRAPAQQPQQQQAQTRGPTTGVATGTQSNQQPIGDQPAQDQPTQARQSPGQITPSPTNVRVQQPTTQNLPTSQPSSTAQSSPVRQLAPIQASPIQSSSPPSPPLVRTSPSPTVRRSPPTR